MISEKLTLRFGTVKVAIFESLYAFQKKRPTLRGSLAIFIFRLLINQEWSFAIGKNNFCIGRSG